VNPVARRQGPSRTFDRQYERSLPFFADVHDIAREAGTGLQRAAD
jgi:hypothetical protein